MDNDTLTMTDSHRQLLQLMQEIHYGKIENITIRDGEPILEPTTTVICDIKLASDSTNRSLPANRGFSEKPQVREMVRQFRLLCNGTVQLLEIHDGLPFRMHARRPIQA